LEIMTLMSCNAIRKRAGRCSCKTHGRMLEYTFGIMALVGVLIHVRRFESCNATRNLILVGKYFAFKSAVVSGVL